MRLHIVSLVSQVLALSHCPSYSVAADERRSRTVELTVVDEADRPAAGARVRARETGGEERVVISDGSGVCLFPRPFHPDHYLVTFTASDATGARQGYLEWRFHDPREAARPLRIVLKPASAVTAHVVDKNGAAVRGADVVVLSQVMQVLTEGRTSAEGSVELAYPADAPAYAIVALQPHTGVATARIEPGAATATRLQLTGGEPIRVRALDSAGMPAVGVAIYPQMFALPRPPGEGPLQVLYEDCRLADILSDERGVAAFDWIPPERRVVNVSGFGVRSDKYVLSLTNMAKTARAYWQGDRDLTVSLLRRTSLSGRVKRDGRPAEGVVIVAQGTDISTNPHREAACTAADGTYALQLTPGLMYAIGVVDDEWAASTRVGVTLAEDEPVDGFDFELGKGTAVRGTITAGADRAPLANQILAMQQFVGEVQADSETLKLSLVPYSRVPQPDEIAARPTVRRTAIYLYRSVTTDAEGRYRISLAPGDYLLQIERAGAAFPKPGVQVFDQAEITHDLYVETAPRTARAGPPTPPKFADETTGDRPLTGTIVGPDGMQVSQANIRGYYAAAIPGVITRLSGDRIPGAGPRSGFTVSSDDSGRFEVKRLSAPLWLFVTSADGALGAQARVAADQQTVAVQLAPAATFVGRLIDGEAPIVGARINVTIWATVAGPGGRNTISHVSVTTATTANDGRFVVPGLIVGAKYSMETGVSSNRLNGNPVVGGVAVARAGKIDLGYLDVPESRFADAPGGGVVWQHVDLAARAANRFAGKTDLADRMKVAADDARRENRRLMLVLGDPQSPATQLLLKALDGIDGPDDFQVYMRRLQARAGGNAPVVDELKRPIADFRRVHVNVLNQDAVSYLARAHQIDLAKLSLPALVILRDDGRVAAARWFVAAGDRPKLDTDALRDFVTEQMLPARNAEELLAAGLRRARDENKRVLVQQTDIDSHASLLLARFIDRHRELFERDYVYVELDTFRLTNGEAVIKRLRPGTGSVPWMAIVDAEGTRLVDSDSPEGNIGFPAEPESIAYFIDTMLKPTARRLTPQQLEELRTALAQ